ncbi:hypothetical protein [Vibrio owensii]|uniref:hypothetical protein n=1 Tax=Vibrio owensii TaxID=696485 RepID=UPI0018F1CE54|nr:hypothetical protein [Vibrio owensii]
MKTRRFCFYTGGTDSTLILELNLQLLLKCPNDDIVIVLVISDILRSGQQEATENAIRMMIGTILDTHAADSDEVINHAEIFDRVSILPINTCSPMQTNVDTTAVDQSGKKHSVQIQSVQADPKMLGFMKQLVTQESILMSAIPAIMMFLCDGHNKIFMGTCGSDIAANNVDKLKAQFDTMLDCMFMLNNNFDLEDELLEHGLKPINRFGQRGFPKYAKPTLHFPLICLKKQDVITSLIHGKSKNFIVDKPEQLMSYYGLTNQMEVQTLTAVYHKFHALHDYDSTFTTLSDFIRTNTLSVGTGENVKHVSAELIEQAIKEEKIKVLAMAMKFIV